MTSLIPHLDFPGVTQADLRNEDFPFKSQLELRNAGGDFPVLLSQLIMRRNADEEQPTPEFNLRGAKVDFPFRAKVDMRKMEGAEE